MILALRMTMHYKDELQLAEEINSRLTYERDMLQAAAEMEKAVADEIRLQLDHYREQIHYLSRSLSHEQDRTGELELMVMMDAKGPQ